MAAQATLTKKETKSSKSVTLVEVTAAVPQEQVNTLRQMIMRYILDNNSEEVAFKLLNMSKTKLSDVNLWVTK
jgi:uncharacterized pyridoxal phosphate-containing UPF0001 family protein